MAWPRQITMNTTLRLSAALAVLVTAAACATPTTAGSAGGSNPPDTGATSSPVARPPAGTPPATRPNEAAPNAKAVDLRPTRWDRVTADGRRLTVHYTATGLAACHTLGRVDVKETPRTITVTLHVGKLPNTDCSGPQPQLAAPTTTVVTLKEPVGTRQVRDGATA